MSTTWWRGSSSQRAIESITVSLEKPNYSGMTTNERLFVAGLLDQWDHAARARDKQQMVLILQRVEISESDAAAIAASVLANPSRYGF
jgi:type IV pilus biogenesis protein CpaD/CtpE